MLVYYQAMDLDAPEGLSTWRLLTRVPRASLIAVGIVALVALTVAFVWRDLIDIHQPFDPLLAGLWIGMTLLLAWRLRPRRDVCLVLSAVAGGFLIEWWGTTTELWTYFTGERPPLWIIPAWPVAALATDRLTMLTERVLPKNGTWRWRLLYALTLVSFVVAMIAFLKPSIAVVSSKVVIAIMIAVTITSTTPRRDFALFLAGSALGWLLEYWGTTRNCWNYYTYQTPPLVTAFAHGFASVAFARATSVLLWGLTMLRPAASHAPNEPLQTS